MKYIEFQDDEQAQNSTCWNCGHKAKEHKPNFEEMEKGEPFDEAVTNCEKCDCENLVIMIHPEADIQINGFQKLSIN